MAVHPIEAFVFDVFGTVVDWRSSVTAELKALGAKHELTAGERRARRESNLIAQTERR